MIFSSPEFAAGQKLKIKNCVSSSYVQPRWRERPSIHGHSVEAGGSSCQALHPNWLWNENPSSESARWLHKLHSSAPSHYPPALAEFLHCVSRRQTLGTPAVFPAMLLLFCSHFVDSQVRHIHHSKQHNIGPHQENKFKNAVYSFWFLFAGQNTKSPNTLLPIQNRHVHALKKGLLTFLLKFFSLSSRNCTLFYIVVTSDIL